MGVPVYLPNPLRAWLCRLISLHGNTLRYRPTSEFLYDYGWL